MKIRQLFANNTFRKWLFYDLCVFLCFMMFLHPLITSDHVWRYEVYATGSYDPFHGLTEVMKHGRITVLLHSCLEALLLPFGINFARNAFVFVLIGMALYAGAATILYELFKPETTDRLNATVTDLAVLLAVVNPLMIETYRYKASNFAIGVFLAALSAYLLLRKKRLAGMVTGWLAVSSYQTNAQIILVICFTYILLQMLRRHFSVKDAVIKAFQYGFCAVALVVFNTLLQVMLANLAGSSGGEVYKVPQIPKSLFTRLYGIYGYNGRLQAVVNDLFGFFPQPRYLILWVAGILAVIVTAELVFRQKRVKELLVLAAGVAVLFVMPLAHCLAGGWTNERQILSFFFMLSGLFILSLNAAEGKSLTAVKCVLCAFALVTLFATESGITDCFINQAVDEDEAKTIQNEIAAYEEKTGTEIRTIVFGGPQFELRYFNEGLLVDYTEFVSTHRIMYDMWARGNYYNIVNGTEYVYENMTEEEYLEHFSGVPKDGFTPSGQMVFEGDTLYLLCY
ncbi:MAG: glucosyltransferase domain-containing protein [Lachnospiraceae bacterium]|nr:glucosyltransferase domain-containing protein [Lachnospiraceae bacterium]